MSFVLHGSPRSPFARRARVALLSVGTVFEWKAHSPQEIWPPNAELLALNPLGLVPALKLPASYGVAGLLDSAEILNFVHTELQPIWPTEKKIHLAARRCSKLAEGVMTYAVRELQGLRVPDPVNARLEDNFETISRALKVLETETRNFPPISKTTLQAQHFWDLAIALQYLDFRHAERFDWRKTTPRLVEIYETLAETTLFRETVPVT